MSENSKHLGKELSQEEISERREKVVQQLRQELAVEKAKVAFLERWIERIDSMNKTFMLDMARLMKRGI